jgi:hypothetical protein
MVLAIRGLVAAVIGSVRGGTSLSAVCSGSDEDSRVSSSSRSTSAREKPIGGILPISKRTVNDKRGR